MRAVMLSLVLLLVPAAGCSATGGSLFNTSTGGSGAGASGTGAGSTNGTGGTGSGPSTTSGMGGLGLGGFVGTGGSPASDCTAAEELVYVFDTDNNIWSFDPPSKQFTMIATANCGDGPNSMAIDRNLVAWLNFDGDGAIYTFDLKTNGPCKPSGINLSNGFEQVGMGFSTDVAGGNTETLYLDGIGGTSGLAKVDMATKQLIMLGDFSDDPSLVGQSCELTGTGNALLYGYFTTDPVRVAQLDKLNANVINDHPLSGVMPPSDWAFSFWGGDFYLYAAPGDNLSGNSSVIHYSPSTGAVDQSYVADTGMTIIGAGVSTCAPITMPM
jgi:hypothetical protein